MGVIASGVKYPKAGMDFVGNLVCLGYGARKPAESVVCQGNTRWQWVVETGAKLKNEKNQEVRIADQRILLCFIRWLPQPGFKVGTQTRTIQVAIKFSTSTSPYLVHTFPLNPQQHTSLLMELHALNTTT